MSDPLDLSELTDKQAAFVREYTVDFCATQAAIRAGYSEKTAGQIGWQNLQIPSIAAAIKERVTLLAMGADEALIRLGRMAKGSLRHFHRLTADGDIEVDLSTKEAQDNIDLLTELEVYTKKDVDDNGSLSMSQRAKLKIHDSKDALKQILRVHGLDQSNLNVHQSGTVEVKVDDVRERFTRRITGIATRIGAGSGHPAANGNGTRGS